MASLETQKIAALNKHWKKFECEHEASELRKRVVKGGGIQYVVQCLKCGRAITRAIARSEALKQNGGKEPPPFDDEIQTIREKAAADGAQKIIGKYETESAFKQAEFRNWYAEYLQSDEWKEKRAKTILRAGGICEGCRCKEATVVHHLTYRDVGDEFLFQLVALCDGCHHRYHEVHPDDE